LLSSAGLAAPFFGRDGLAINSRMTGGRWESLNGLAMLREPKFERRSGDAEMEEEKKSLAEIGKLIVEIASRLHLPASDLPTLGISEQSGRPHIEVGDACYFYVIAERGTEHRRVSFEKLDDLLYAVAYDVTSIMSSIWQSQNELPNVDQRRQAFARQRFLLAGLNPEWERRCEERHAAILREYPFRDIPNR
jgi:hypothetical protein